MTRLHPNVVPSAERVLVIHGKRLLGYVVYIAVGSFSAALWSTSTGVELPATITLSLAVSALLGIVFIRSIGWPIAECRRYRSAPGCIPFSPFTQSREAHHRILQSILTALWMRELFLAFQYREVMRRIEGD